MKMFVRSCRGSWFLELRFLPYRGDDVMSISSRSESNFDGDLLSLPLAPHFRQDEVADDATDDVMADGPTASSSHELPAPEFEDRTRVPMPSLSSNNESSGRFRHVHGGEAARGGENEAEKTRLRKRGCETEECQNK